MNRQTVFGVHREKHYHRQEEIAGRKIICSTNINAKNVQDVL
jgi:hypothetical protein